ncbi:MAG: magnesium/cobalt transporter CorA [Phycisphaerae bacterium]
MKLRRKQTLAAGAVPGELVIQASSPKPRITVMAYDAADLDVRSDVPADQLLEQVSDAKVVWIDVQGLGDETQLRRIAADFGIHRLALADVVNAPQRPKVDDYGEKLLYITRMFRLEGQTEEESVSEQVSVLLGKGFVITFQEKYGDCLEPVRNRIRTDKGIIRQMGADYLAYAIVDAITDGYYPVLEAYGEKLEDMERTIVDEPTNETLAEIYRVRRELLSIRRAVWPARDAVNSIIRDRFPLIGKDVLVYFRDCYDHTVQIMDTVESYRELAGGLTDAYMSAVSNRMNEVMKVLTIIATIFIPLSFVCGVYGMNFNTEISPWNMPELNWPFGYVLFWCVAILVAGGMLTYFRKRKWL